MTSKERSEALKAVFTKAKINVQNVSSLGDFVHIDTYKKYSVAIANVMQLAGFSLMFEAGGKHLSGYVGHRMSFKLK